MSTAARVSPFDTLADVQERLGNVPADRVVMNPPPGLAAEADLLDRMRRTGRPCELVDGILVEKAKGYREGSLGGWLIRLIGPYLDKNNLGDLAAADATMRVLPGVVRLPDVSFTRWERMPNGEVPSEPIPDLCPDLAVEILSKNNSAGEILRKLKEYFLGGTSIAWIVDPVKRTVKVHTAPDVSKTLTEADTLDGGALLPGFTLPVARVFERMPTASAKPAKKRKKRPSA